MPPPMPDAPDRRRFVRQLALGGAGAALGGLASARHAFADARGRLALPRHTAATFPALRSEYLLGPDVVYLNHASIGTIPRAVHEARQRYLDLCETNPWRYMWGGAWDEAREAVRAKAGALLNVAPERIAVLHNTTEAFNLLAHGLPLGPGDEVVFSSLNHAGASVAFEHVAAARGFAVRRFPFPAAEIATLTADDVLDRYDRQLTSRTKLLVLPHIDNAVGLRHPVARLARLARDRGVDFVAVDAAQTIGMIPVDARALGADLVVTSAHKWLQAPKGLGLAYVSEALQDLLRPMWVTWGQGRWQGTARIYEDYGTRNLPEVIALGDAIDFQMQIDPAERERRLRHLHALARRLADETPGLRWRSPRAWSLGGSLYAVETEGRDSAALFDVLFAQHGLVFRPFRMDGFHTVRLSPNVFTTDDALARFFELAA